MTLRRDRRWYDRELEAEGHDSPSAVDVIGGIRLAPAASSHGRSIRMRTAPRLARATTATVTVSPAAMSPSRHVTRPPSYGAHIAGASATALR